MGCDHKHVLKDYLLRYDSVRWLLFCYNYGCKNRIEIGLVSCFSSCTQIDKRLEKRLCFIFWYTGFYWNYNYDISIIFFIKLTTIDSFFLILTLFGRNLCSLPSKTVYTVCKFLKYSLQSWNIAFSCTI